MRASSIYVNLPIKNIEKTREFWQKLGFSFDENYSNEKALCLILREGLIYAMLLIHDFFSTFTNRKIADDFTTEAIIAIQVENRDKVDEIVNLALKFGTTKFKEKVDLGWMYYDSFIDIDGHQWEIMCLNNDK
jgi:predicted lactoylglutathione lyase